MFVRSTLLQAISSSRLFPSVYETLCISKKIAENGNFRINGVTFLFTRCYSGIKDDNKKSSSDTVNPKKTKTLEDEDNIEIFDVERERSVLKSGDLSKYKVFKDEDAPLILDVEEERLISQTIKPGLVPQRSEFEGISLERGLHGVFDIDELVSILKDQNAQDVVVLEIPQTLGYADHMIIISGRSSRHLMATASYIRRLFKKKMHKNDKVPIIEGKRNKNEDWLALDLGNIILHLFSKKTRQIYDLESLWALGPEFDPHLNQTQDPLAAIITKHSLHLADLQPADSKQ